MVRSLWNHCQAFHFGFSSISLIKVCIKPLLCRCQTWFQPKVCESVFQFVRLHEGELVYLLLRLNVDVCFLTVEAAVILPVVSVWSTWTRQHFAAWVRAGRAHEPRRVGVMQRGEKQKPPGGKKPGLRKTKTPKMGCSINRMRWHTSAQSKRLVNGENKDYFYDFSSRSPKAAVTAEFILFHVPIYCWIVQKIW